jgi:hypothetical protein
MFTFGDATYPFSQFCLSVGANIPSANSPASSRFMLSVNTIFRGKIKLLESPRMYAPQNFYPSAPFGCNIACYFSLRLPNNAIHRLSKVVDVMRIQPRHRDPPILRLHNERISRSRHILKSDRRPTIYTCHFSLKIPTCFSVNPVKLNIPI